MTKVAGGADGAAAWYLPTRSGARAAGGEVVAAAAAAAVAVSAVEAAESAADAVAVSAASAPSVVITPGVDSVVALTVSSKPVAS